MRHMPSPEKVNINHRRIWEGTRTSEDIANEIKSGRANWQSIISLISTFECVNANNIAITNHQKVQTCKSYLYALIDKYCSNIDDREILLMTFGILRGYEDIKNLEGRRLKYMQHMGNSLKPESKTKACKRAEDKIIEWLAYRIAIDLNKGVVPLGLIGAIKKGYPPEPPQYNETSRLYRKPNKTTSKAEEETDTFDNNDVLDEDGGLEIIEEGDPDNGIPGIVKVPRGFGLYVKR